MAVRKSIASSPSKQLSGIYSIVCRANGRIYIGSAVNIAGRWHAHRCLLRRGIHCNSKLQRNWNKYGEQSFDFKVIEYVAVALLVVREQYFIDALEGFGDGGMNLSPTAGSCLGSTRSQESKKRMSERMKGTKRTAEQIQKQAEAMRGRKQGPAVIARRREKMLAIWADPGSKMKRKHNEETKRKMSEAKKGRSKSLEHAAKIAESNRKRFQSGGYGTNIKGRKRTPETIEKMRQAAVRREAAKRQRTIVLTENTQANSEAS